MGGLLDCLCSPSGLLGATASAIIGTTAHNGTYSLQLLDRGWRHTDLGHGAGTRADPPYTFAKRLQTDIPVLAQGHRNSAQHDDQLLGRCSLTGSCPNVFVQDPTGVGIPSAEFVRRLEELQDDTSSDWRSWLVRMDGSSFSFNPFPATQPASMADH